MSMVSFLILLTFQTALPHAQAQDITPPSDITDLFASSGTTSGSLALTWSAPEDDANGGQILGGWYRLDHSSDAGHGFSSDTYQVQLPTTTAPGRRESLGVSGLLGNYSYYLRMFAADDVPNFSGLSNGATAVTIPYEPLAPRHSANSLSLIAWAWSLPPENKTGTEYYASDGTGESGWVPNGNTLISASKGPNTPYILNVKARNSSGVSSTIASTQAYTSIQTPTGVGFDMVGVSSITVRAAGTLSNIDQGASGTRLANDSVGTDSGWIQGGGWTSVSLSSNTAYSFSAMARNGDAEETGQVISFTATLLYPPDALDLALAADSSTQLTLSVTPPPNQSVLSTGAEFQNLEGPGGQGSGKLTGAYSFVNAGLSPNRRYGYRVRWFNATNVPTDYGPPRTLYTRAAPPAPLPYSGNGPDRVQANWGGNGNPAGTWYAVELSTDSFATLAASSQTRNSFAVFSGLSPSSPYRARVSAANEDGVATAAADLGLLSLPFPPLSPSHAADGLDYVSWIWTLDPRNPAGTQIYAEDGTGNSGWVPDLDGWDKTGKTPNTVYTLSVRSRNGDGVESANASTAAYTSIETPTNVTFDMVGASSVTARALGTFSGLGAGLSGVRLAEDGGSSDSGWTTALAHTFLALSSNTVYSFSARARNGDAQATDFVANVTATLLYPPTADDLGLTADSSTQISLTAAAPPNANFLNTGCQFANTGGAGGDGSAKLTGTYAMTDYGLSPNTLYSYRVRWYNAFNVPTEYGPARGRYTLAAVPLGAAFTGAGEDRLQANWTANDNPSGTLYTVEISSDGFATLNASSQTRNTSAVFTGLSPTAPYAGRVKAANEEGVETPYAELGAAVLAYPPLAPTHTGNTAAAVSWSWTLAPENPLGTAHYAEDGTGDSGWVAGLSAWTNGGKAPNTEYTLRVKARNASGVETPAVTTAAYTSIEPAASVALAVVGASSITVSLPGTFTNVAAAQSGFLFVNETAGTASGWLKASSWTSVGLASNTFHVLTGRSRNGNADETPEQTAIVATRLFPPAGGDLVLTAGSSTQILLNAALPPNDALGQTGSQFDHVQGAGGTDSPKLTGVYSFANHALLPNTLYGYRLRYYNVENAGTDFGPVAYRRTLAASPLPLAYGTPGPDLLQAGWGANNNPAGTVFIAELSTDSFATLTHASATVAASALFSGFTPGMDYRLRVKAVNGETVDTPYTDLGTFRAVAPPTDPTHTANSTDTVSWAWTPAPANPASTEFAASDETGTSGWVADAAAWTGTGKTPNTLYTLTVKARSVDAVETPAASTQAYTSMRDPSGAAFDMTGTSSVTVRALGTFDNVSAGLSGLELVNATAGTGSGWGGAASWTSTGLSSNTLYSFAVRARNGDGEPTADAAATKATLLHPPSPQDFLLTADSPTQISLAVSPPPNPALGLTGCDFLWVSGAGGSSSGRLAAAYSHLNAGLTPNGRYGYRVRWYNAEDQATDYTPVSYRHTLAAPPTPLPLTAGTSIQLQANWGLAGNSPGTDFSVAATRDAFATVAASSLTKNAFAVVSGLLPNTTYALRVKAVNGDGVDSVYTALGSTRTLSAPPLAPGHSGRTVDSVSWTWSLDPQNPPGTQYFAQDPNGNSGWVPDGTAWTSGGKTANTFHVFSVRTRNGDNSVSPVVSTNAYSGIEPAAGVAFDMVGTSSVTARVLGSFSNMAFSFSGVQLTDETQATASNWMKTLVWTDVGLASNTLYAFSARSRNASAYETDPTVAVSTWTRLDTPAAGLMTLSADSSAQITLNAALPPNPTAGATGVEFQLTSGPGGHSSGRLTGTYSFKDTGLTPDSQYGYRFRYVNAAGFLTDYSPILTRYTLANVPAPQSFSGLTQDALRANWGANGNPPGVPYLVELSTDGFATLSGSSRTLAQNALFFSLTPNTTYAARVTALNAENAPSAWAPLSSTATFAQPPAAPAISEVGGDSFLVSWDGAGNGPRSLYEAQVSTRADFALLAASSATEAVSARLAGLQTLTTYYARVRTNAFNGAFTAFVDAGSTITLADAVPPGAITDLVAAPGPAEGQLRLTWTAPGDDGWSGNALGYRVRLSPAPIPTQSAFDQAPAIAQAWIPVPVGAREDRVLTGLVPGATYYAAIEAVDDSYNPGGLSNAAGSSGWAQWDVTPPAARADLAAVSSSSGTILVGWTAPGDDGASGTATAYDLRYSPLGPLDSEAKFLAAQPAPAPAPAAPGTPQTALVTGLAEATTYYLALRARDERLNWSGLSNLVVRRTSNLNPPAAPRWAAEPVTAAGGRLRLDWLDNPEDDLSAYRLFRGTESGGPYDLLWTAPAGVSAYEDAGLDNGTTYYYALTVLDSAGLESAYSVEVSSVTADLLPPEAPAGVKVLIGDDGRYTLEWSPTLHDADGAPLEGLAGYRIYRAAALTGPYVLQAAPLAAGPFSWTEPAPVGPGYFSIRAADDHGNESADSLIAAPDLALHASAADGSSRLRIPRAIAAPLYKAGNAYAQDIRLDIARTASEEGGRVLWSGEVRARRADSLSAVPASFAFPSARAELFFKVAGLGTAAFSAKDAAVFWFDGTEWVKLGGEVDPAAGTIVVETSRVGRFQVRRSLRTGSVSIMQIVPRKIFTPNGDGVNDAIEFFFDNLSDSVFAQAKIFDLTGAEVSDLRLGSTGDSYVWDGRAAGGSVVPGGIYIYQFQVAGNSLNGTVVVAK